MNKRKILYIVALILSLMFICVVAFNQSPIEETSKHDINKSSVETIKKPKVSESDDQQEITIIHQEEMQTKEDYKNLYQEYQVSPNGGFKSYMPYTTITSESSPQYILQNQYAYTGEFGIRKVEDRFCIAIGRFSNARVGTYVDLILENEIVIPCIVGDFKANVHTDSSNMVTGHNGCVSEFVVEKERLPYVVRNNDNTGSGNMSHCKEEWKSPVKIIKVYEENIFDGE